MQSLKGRDGQTSTRHRGDIHAKRKGRCPEQRPYHYAKNRSHDLPLGRGVRQRIWSTLNIHQQTIPRSPTSGRAASKPPCVEDQSMKRPGEKNHREAAEADQSPGEGERQQGQKKKGQDPLLRWLEGHTLSPRQKRRQQNVEPTPFRADRPTKGWHKDTSRTGRKKRSQEPNCSNSFIRDQIVRSRPDRQIYTQ